MNSSSTCYRYSTSLKSNTSNKTFLTKKFTSHFIFELCVWKYRDPWKKFQCINQSIVIGVTYYERAFARSKDVLELNEIDWEVVANWFVRGKKVTKFWQFYYCELNMTYCSVKCLNFSWMHFALFIDCNCPLLKI